MKEKYLRIDVGPRYLEDSSILFNGKYLGDIDYETQIKGDEAPLMPFIEKTEIKDIWGRKAVGYRWKLTIDLSHGTILDWPEDIFADIHYKVCDDGNYTLLDKNFNEITSKNMYVPKLLAYKDEDYGFGDYIIMNIDGGKIIDWPREDLKEFVEQIITTEGW